MVTDTPEGSDVYMTGYSIRLGYNANGPEAPATALVSAAVALRHQPEALVAEAHRAEPQRAAACDQALLWQCAQHYGRADDYTLLIDADDEQPIVRQLASGGGPERAVKELLRRAYCRLLMAEMHRQGIEVNLVVA